jgi:hypothetical protein
MKCKLFIKKILIFESHFTLFIYLKNLSHETRLDSLQNVVFITTVNILLDKII